MNNDYDLRIPSVEKSILKFKEEVEEHLEAINQNTNEIQALYDYLYELDSKIEKLTERLDEIQMMLSPSCSRDINDIKLTTNEKDIFLIIYSSENPISINDIAKKIGISPELVNSRITAMKLKGIPMLSQIVDGEEFVSLELRFKDLQSRNNILKISYGEKLSVSNIFNQN